MKPTPFQNSAFLQPSLGASLVASLNRIVDLEGKADQVEEESEDRKGI